MPVSVCTRLPTRSAVCARSCKHGADRADLAASAYADAQLAEDLRLADHHRVQPGRHGEHVLGGGLGEVDVEVLGQIGDRRARSCRASTRGDLGDRRVEAGDVGVDLDAVARRQQQHLADGLGAVQLVEHLAQVLGGTAARSSTGTGAVRWDRPTTSRLTAPPRPLDDARLTAPPPQRAVLAVLVEGQDLQLGGEVDLAHVDVRRHRQHDRREVQDAGDAGGDEPVADLLRHVGRDGQHGDRDVLARDDPFEVVDVCDDQPADRRADPRRVGVDQGGDPEPAASRTRRSRPAPGPGCRCR